MMEELKFTSERDTPDIDYMQPRFQQGFYAYHFARDYCVDKLVLDAGCGEGYGTHYLAQVARYIVGIDRDLVCIKHARNRYRENNIAFFVMDVCHLAIPDESFDVVISFAVTEHVPHPHLYFRELARVVRPDGTVILEALNRQTPIPLDPWHYQEFNAGELHQALHEVFQEVKLYGLCGRTPRAIKYRNKRKKWVQLLVRLGAIELRRHLPHKVYLQLYLSAQKWLRIWLWKRHLQQQGLTIDDFTVTEDNLEKSWSFFAVCHKPAPSKPLSKKHKISFTNAPRLGPG